MIIMKKVMLTMAGMLFMGVVAIQAQSQDTTIAPQQQQQRDTTVAPPQSQDPQQQQQQPEKQEGSYQLRDMTAVQASEVPAALRETLQGGSNYKGWEDPTTKIYRSRNSDLFVVQIMDGTETKTYRFDRNGKPIEE
jgi:hypothetical protein